MKKRDEDVWFNVICITRGWVGVKFLEKKRYVTREGLLRYLRLSHVPAGRYEDWGAADTDGQTGTKERLPL